MESSPSSSSIYQQYKHDTTVVASWLAHTAKDSGFNGPIGETAYRKVPYTGRPKGKDRKLAKVSQLPKNEAIESSSTAGSSASADPPKPKYILAIGEFVPLAEHIARASETASIKLPNFFSVLSKESYGFESLSPKSWRLLAELPTRDRMHVIPSSSRFWKRFARHCSRSRIRTRSICRI